MNLRGFYSLFLFHLLAGLGLGLMFTDDFHTRLVGFALALIGFFFSFLDSELKMNCSVCGEKITICDECGDKFHKGDKVFCCSDDFDKHKCTECHVPVEEGEVE